MKNKFKALILGYVCPCLISVVTSCIITLILLKLNIC